MPTEAVVHPLISVILATRNERGYIADVLESLVHQYARNFDLEILVVDGKSTDGTLEIARQFAADHKNIRVLINENQTTPSAFNLGLVESRGEFVAILGAHAVYDCDYLSTCFAELNTHRATACGGLVETWPADPSLQAQLVSWLLGHWFGSSTKSFRTRREGFADGVNFPVMIRHAVVELGGYDVQLHRNQDNDLNQRLRARGHKLFVTAKTKCRYFSKRSIFGLLQYAFRSGAWNLLSFKKNRRAMSVRHFVPFLFAFALCLAVALCIGNHFFPERYHLLVKVPVVVILGAHLCCGTMASFQVAVRKHSFAPLLLAPLFLAFHLAYGLGTCWALLKRQQLSTWGRNGSTITHTASALADERN